MADLHNVILHHLKLAILEKFDSVQLVCDGGLTKRMIIDKSYEAKLQNVEDQFKRLMVGLERLDDVETKSDFIAVAKKIKAVAGEDLSAAIVDYLDSYLRAVFSSCESTLK